jgi:hypothetical protein
LHFSFEKKETSLSFFSCFFFSWSSNFLNKYLVLSPRPLTRQGVPPPKSAVRKSRAEEKPPSTAQNPKPQETPPSSRKKKKIALCLSIFFFFFSSPNFFESLNKLTESRTFLVSPIFPPDGSPTVNYLKTGPAYPGYPGYPPALNGNPPAPYYYYPPHFEFYPPPLYFPVPNLNPANIQPTPTPSDNYLKRVQTAKPPPEQRPPKTAAAAPVESVRRKKYLQNLHC